MDDPKNELQYVNGFEQAFLTLTEEDVMAIDLAAFNFAASVAVSPEWLLKEAIERVLDGRRKWPPRKPTRLRNFLCGVMKSIKDEVCKNLPAAIDCHYMQLESHPKPPEEQLKQQEREEWAERVVESTLDHFSDDEQVLAILIGKSEGLSGEEIRNQENITRKQYDTALKRLSRYRNANYPRGNRNE